VFFACETAATWFMASGQSLIIPEGRAFNNNLCSWLATCRAGGCCFLAQQSCDRIAWQLGPETTEFDAALASTIVPVP